MSGHACWSVPLAAGRRGRVGAAGRGGEGMPGRWHPCGNAPRDSAGETALLALTCPENHSPGRPPGEREHVAHGPDSAVSQKGMTMSRLRKAVALSAIAAVIASGLAVIAPTAASAASALDSATVLDLPFDDALTDVGPNKIATSMLRGQAAYVAGIDGRALSLTGDDAVSLGTSAALQPQNLTLSFWFKPDGAMGTGEQVFTWNKGAYNTAGWYLTAENANTPLALSIGPANQQPYKVTVNGPRDAFFP
ncbi:MAG: LamG domain-containing protein, partial [Actinobacteria bacterium]|nr:LamG domain-containing protein [Actinomycetota bacterium]